MSDLPSGWTTAPVTDFASLHDSRRIPLNAKQRETMRGRYPYYGANGLVDHVNDYLFDGEYTLLAEDGGYFDEPKRGVAYEVSGRFWVNNHAHILEPLGGISNRFLRYALNAFNWMPYVGGSTRLKLTQGGLQRARISLPPLPEQQRIVAKIDSLSGKSKRARDHLDHIPRLVEKYKQAILGAALNGQLTRGWRQANPTATSDLVLNELRTNCLSRRRSSIPTRNLVSSDHLPASWAVVRLEDISSDIVDGTHHTPEYVASGIPFISVKDIRDGLIDFSECKYISPATHEQLAKRCGPRPGDVLITKSGTIGRCAVVQNVQAFSLFVSVALIRPAAEGLRSRFLEYALRYWVSTIDTSSDITGSTIKNLHLQDIKALGTPLPPPAEQDDLISKVDAAFAWIDRLASEATFGRKLIDRLDEAVLAKAFRGELVPQDLNDEPAVMLLERIKAEREKTGPARRVRRSKLTASA